jgi:hypothetical protein
MSQEQFGLVLPEAKRTGRGEGDRAVKEKPPSLDEVAWKRVGGVLSRRPKCDPCVYRMVLGGPWYAPDPVTWERTGDGTQVYLCHWHSAPLRAGEGLAP